jgi:hypothetical protein
MDFALDIDILHELQKGPKYVAYGVGTKDTGSLKWGHNTGLVSWGVYNTHPCLIRDTT